MSLNTDMSIFLQTSSILSASFEHFLLRSHSGNRMSHLIRIKYYSTYPLAELI